MSNSIQCFFLEPTGTARRSLRRCTPSAEGDTCPAAHGYHTAQTVLDDVVDAQASGDLWPHEDERWPTHCACGYEFTEADAYQLNHQTLYRRSDTGELTTIREAPVGAMWYADWFLEHLPEGPAFYRGPDGHCLVVKTPGGEWMVDARCSNCTLPGDTEHKCWVRRGEVPYVTVSKEGGPTCSAGAGSIQCGRYHGFLRNGRLEEC